MINFDAIPDKNPSGAIDAGTYKFKITKVEMKQPTDTGKKQYLSLQMNLTTPDGKTAQFEDNHYDSDSSFILFKLKRFVESIGVNLTGSVNLSDISKLVRPGAEGVVVIAQTENTYKGVKSMKAQVDVFNSDCYYPISEWSKFCADAGVSADTPETTQEDTPPDVATDY